MKYWLTLFVSLWACTLAAGLSIGSWENSQYTRSVDLAKSYVKETCIVQAKNIGDEPQNVYYFTLNDGLKEISQVSAFVATLLDQPVVVDSEIVDEATNLYKLTFPIPVAPGSSVQFKARYIYLSAIQPLPAKIEMAETQNLLLKLNKFVYSPYVTLEYSMIFTGITKGQEMELLTFTTEDIKVTENTPTIKPRVENKALVYGPVLEKLDAYTVEPMGLLYEHNRPLAKVNSLERSLWIPASNAEKVSFEEYYELTNDAAQLSSGFLRIDWMRGHYDSTRNHWAISQLDIKLPEDIPEGIYYTDKVGQVSTSKIYLDHLILTPRFPIFGGWNYNFTIGWYSPVAQHVHKIANTDDTYIVKFPLLNSIDDITYDKVDVNFYLPENAEFIGVSSAIDYDLITIGEELSYLDVSSGHVKISLHFKDLIDDLSKVDLYVQYKYTQSSYWWKVFKISGFVFTGLMSFYLLSLIDVSIEKK